MINWSSSLVRNSEWLHNQWSMRSVKWFQVVPRYASPIYAVHCRRQRLDKQWLRCVQVTAPPSTVQPSITASSPRMRDKGQWRQGDSGQVHRPSWTLVMFQVGHYCQVPRPSLGMFTSTWLALRTSGADSAWPSSTGATCSTRQYLLLTNAISTSRNAKLQVQSDDASRQQQSLGVHRQHRPFEAIRAAHSLTNHRMVWQFYCLVSWRHTPNTIRSPTVP